MVKTTNVTHVEIHLLNQGYCIDTFFQCQKHHKRNTRHINSIHNVQKVNKYLWKEIFEDPH